MYTRFNLLAAEGMVGMGQDLGQEMVIAELCVCIFKRSKEEAGGA